MEAEPLFIQRCEQIVLLLQSQKEMELLDLGGLLRQLLMDKFSLLDTANKNRVKPIFHVGQFTLQPDKYTQWLALEDGLDPETRPPWKPSTNLTRDEFLRHVVIVANGVPISVKDVIFYAANIAGGVHHDPRSKTDALAVFSKHLGIGGLPAGIRQLKAIARVTIRSLQPVIEDVKQRAAPSVAPTPSLGKIRST
jgi:hypothetical protein